MAVYAMREVEMEEAGERQGEERKRQGRGTERREHGTERSESSVETGNAGAQAGSGRCGGSCGWAGVFAPEPEAVLLIHVSVSADFDHA